MGPCTQGSEIFKRMTETLRTSTNATEKAPVVRFAQDVAAKLVAWSTELRECNEHGDLAPEMITGGYRNDRLHRVCAKCNGARTTPGRPRERHQCPPRPPVRNFYWTGYGIEARDPDRPEWLNV